MMIEPYHIEQERIMQELKEKEMNKQTKGARLMFEEYVRTNVAEMRQVTELDIYKFQKHKLILLGEKTVVSISQADKDNGSPKVGDMIARNPKNHHDQWLVAEKYFKENFKLKEQG